MTEKQHYVPVFYLRNFTFDNKRSRLYLYDKVIEKIVPVHVRDIAHSSYFYDLPRDAQFQPDASKAGIDFQVVENALSNIEGKFAELVKGLVSLKVGDSIDDAQRVGISFLLVNLLFRTVDFRMFLKEVAEKAGSAMLLQMGREKFPELTSEELGLKIQPWQLTIQHLQFMLNKESTDEFVDALSSHILQIGVAPSGTSLFTSDSPVVREGHCSHPVLSMTGLASPGIEIALPISPTMVILLRERTYFEAEAAQDCRVTPLSPDDVDRLNSLQVKQGHRQIYSKTDTGFDLAKDILKEEPLFRVPDRAHIAIDSSNGVLHIKPASVTTVPAATNDPVRPEI